MTAWVAASGCAALLMLAMLCGCAASGAAPQYADSGAQPIARTAAQQSAPGEESGFTGLWVGTSTTNCMPLQPDARRCNAVVKITLQMFQQGSTLTGYYTCATGTMVCRDSNNSGTIANGEVRGDGVAMRVMLPDGSSCLFNGRPPPQAANILTGTFFCMQGGGYMEKGRFQVERSY